MITGFTRELCSCDSYIKGKAYEEELSGDFLESCCGWSHDLCRDLDFVPIPDLNCFGFRLTCKETATEACKNDVKAFHTIWAEVPPKDDEACFNAYKETELWATSCN